MMRLLYQKQPTFISCNCISKHNKFSMGSCLLHGGYKLGCKRQSTRQQAMLHLCVYLQLCVYRLCKQQAYHQQNLQTAGMRSNKLKI